jgi:tRNA(adenine34) deaminase
LLNDVTAHAEMQAITAAANYLGGKYLKDCTMYVSHWNLARCWSLVSQISKIVLGQAMKVAVFQNGYATPSKTVVKRGVLAEEASDLMKRFLRKGRLSNQFNCSYSLLFHDCNFHN